MQFLEGSSYGKIIEKFEMKKISERNQNEKKKKKSERKKMGTKKNRNEKKSFWRKMKMDKDVHLYFISLLFIWVLLLPYDVMKQQFSEAMCSLSIVK